MSHVAEMQTEAAFMDTLLRAFAGELGSHDPATAGNACAKVIHDNLQVDTTQVIDTLGNVIGECGTPQGSASRISLRRLAECSASWKGTRAVLLYNGELGNPFWYLSEPKERGFKQVEDGRVPTPLREHLRALSNGKRIQIKFFPIMLNGRIVGYGLTTTKERYFDETALGALGTKTCILASALGETVQRITRERSSVFRSVDRLQAAARQSLSKSRLLRLAGFALTGVLLFGIPFGFSLSGKGVFEPRKLTVQHAFTLGGAKATILQINPAISPGQWVEAGTWLATLDSAELRAEENRNSELIEQLVSEEAALTAKRRRGGDGEARSAKQEIDAQLRGVETQLAQAMKYRESLALFRAGLKLVAPTSGVLLEPVKFDNLLQTTYDAGAPIFMIGDTSAYEVMVEVSEQKYRLIKREPGERHVTWYIEPGIEFQGKVVRMHELPAKSSAGTKTFRLVVSVSPDAYERYDGQVDLSVVAKIDCGHRCLASKFGGWRLMEWLQELTFEYWGPSLLPQ